MRNKVFTLLLTLIAVAMMSLAAPAANAQTVNWRSIVGVITAPDDPTTPVAENINNPVGKVFSGSFPWSVRTGVAQVDLSTGSVHFDVKGLEINGQVFSGTPGPVNAVEGTLVCNAGEQNEAEIDTPDAPINSLGNAHFTGILQDIPTTCDNPLFLIRIATIANPQNPDAAR